MPIFDRSVVKTQFCEDDSINLSLWLLPGVFSGPQGPPEFEMSCLEEVNGVLSQVIYRVQTPASFVPQNKDAVTRNQNPTRVRLPLNTYRIYGRFVDDSVTNDALLVTVSGKPELTVTTTEICSNQKTKIIFENTRTDLLAGSYVSFTWQITNRNNVTGGEEQTNEKPGPKGSSCVDCNDVYTTADGKKNGTTTPKGTYESEQTLTLTNSARPGSVDYVVTPISSIAGCKGDPKTVHLTVNPLPEIAAFNPNRNTVCSASRVDITPKQNGTIPNVQYVWTATVTEGVNVGQTTTLDLATNPPTITPKNKIEDLLTLPTARKTSIDVLYQVNAVYVPGNVTSPNPVYCLSANKESITATLHPKPAVDPITDKNVCHADRLNIPLAADVSNEIKFEWTSTNEATGLKNGKTAVSSSPKIEFVAANTSVGPITTNVSVTASVGDGVLACSSNAVTFTITVNPVPSINPIPDQTHCAGESSTAVSFSGSLGGETFSWTNDNTNTGIPLSGGAQFPSVPLANPSNTSRSIASRIAVTAAKLGCMDTKTFSVTVSPQPRLQTDLRDILYCNDTDVKLSVAPDGPSSGYKYEWQVSPSGNTANFVSINASNAGNQYANYDTKDLTISKTPEALSGYIYRVLLSNINCPNLPTQSKSAIITSIFKDTKPEIVDDKVSLNYGERVNFKLSNRPVVGAYNWNFGDNWYSTEVNPTHYFYKKGTFTPTLKISALYCEKEFTLPSITVDGLATDGEIVITEDPLPADAPTLVYPLPATDRLTIQTARDMYGIQLFDGVGKLSFHISLAHPIRRKDINLLNLSSGLYVLRIIYQNGVESIKIKIR